MRLFDLLKKLIAPEPIAPPAAPLPPCNTKSENHKIAGIQHHADSFMKLAVPNPDYKLNKKQLISKGLVDRRIYEYTFNIPGISLVEEPTNPYDPNAIQVVAGSALLGYIKKGSCSHVKNLLHSGNIVSITLTKFSYGKYKGVYEECEIDDKIEYELDRGTSTGYGEIRITYKI